MDGEDLAEMTRDVAMTDTLILFAFYGVGLIIGGVVAYIETRREYKLKIHLQELETTIERHRRES